MDPRSSWAAGKQIDGIAGEWTFPLWVLRAMRFHLRERTYYERLNSYEHVLEALVINERLASAGLSGMSVRTVIEIFEGAMSAPEGRLAEPSDTERFLGLHQVGLVDARAAGGGVTFANSWGDRWGARNTGVLTESYLRKHGRETWLYRQGDFGHACPDSFEFFAPNLLDADLQKAWTRRANSGRQRLNGDRSIRWFESRSLFRASSTLVVEVRNRSRTRLGWCHLELGSSDGTPVALISELFVWPTYRMTGVATELLQWARRHAIEFGSVTLQLLVHEADTESSIELPRAHIASKWGLVWHEQEGGYGGGVRAIAGETLEPVT